MSGRLLVRLAFASRILLALSLSAPILMKWASPAEARGPLRSNTANPRYFVDSLGNPVYLAGSYQNPYNLLSGRVSEVASYFDFLAQQNQNFTRLWAWEQSPWTYDQNGNVTFTLQPYERSGTGAALDGGLKFDLTRFNQAYFDQLRSRIIAAGQRGIYVSLILFEGFSSQRRVRQVDPWLADPFHGANNVNGINADENGDGRGIEFFSLNSPPLTALQEAFVRKVVDTLENLDNVLYEVSGDTLPSSLAWQFHMLDYLKSYQATKLNRHPVGISQFYGKSLSDVLSSAADWVVIQGNKAIPALAVADKVLVLEGTATTSKQPTQWVWQSFVRGYNPIYSESDGGVASSEIHAAIGQTKAYAALLDMTSMTPSDTACSNRLCLVNSRSQYLTYLPTGGSVTVDLSNATGNLTAAWFDPTSGQTLSENATSGGQRVSFSSPVRGPSVLQVTGNRAILSNQQRPAAASTSSSLISSASETTTQDTVYASRFALQDNAVATPTITPNGGIYSGSVKVTVQTSTPGATIYYTTDGQTPTTSSQRYKNGFSLSSSTLVKAIAFKNNMSPSAPVTAWFSNSAISGNIFDYSLSISGDVAVTPGTSGSANLSATLNSGSAQPVSFAVSGLPSGATANLSAPSCNPSCSSVLNIVTAASTPTGNFPITVTATSGSLKKAAAFALTVAAPSAVAAPIMTPNGGNFSNSVSVSMETSTSGAAIYYTTNGSSPTQSSTVYTGPIVLANSAIIKAKAFKSGFNPSTEVSASFTKSTTNTGTPSLVAHWKFDEGIGNIAADSSGNGNSGTIINGPKWASGIAGHALSFDGTDDSVDVLSSISLNLANIFTLSAWVNPTATFTDFRSILVKNYKYFLYSSVAGYCGDGSPLGGFAEITNNTVCHLPPLPMNSWTHLAVTSDGSTLTLYRNGFAVATSPATETLLPANGSLQIGASQFGEHFQGLIDEIQIYNKALSAAEIQTIYKQLAVNLPFDYAVSTSGNKSVTAGSSITNFISTSLVSGVSQAVSFSVSGLPSGATSSWSAPSCNPNCSSVLTISTTASTPAGNLPITVTATGGGLKKEAAFTFTVSAPATVAAPIITPNGGTFTNSVSVSMASSTSGASIYYTTNGSTPTQSSTLYSGPIALTNSTTIKAKAFKSGLNPSPEVSASFTKSTTNIGTPGLVAHWKFDDGIGNIATDVSGNNNVGTLTNGPKWVSGVAGHALSFDGTDDSVDVLSSNSLNVANTFTLSAWVNPTATFTDFRSILVKNYKYYLYSSVAGYCGDASPLGGFAETTSNTVCHPTPLPINTWTHLAVTSDGSTLTLYRNGFAEATNPATETLLPANGSLQIGASQFGEHFQGLIDEIQIYNKPLSAAEIQSIYKQLAINLPFDYVVSTSGNKSITAGSSITNSITTKLVSGVSQPVSFTVSGLPSGATPVFSSASCAPNCSTILTIATTGTTAAGNYPITVTAAGGGMKKSTIFNLSVTFALTVATPTITPNGGVFSNSVTVSVQSATAGSSIYYTTDGSTPTQSSSLYNGAMALTSDATIKAAAFKSGYNPSAVATAAFTNSTTNSSGTGKAYYVATNGSDSNTGTLQNPFRTITRGLSVVAAGDTLYIRGGTYPGINNYITRIPSGTSWNNPITIAAYLGESVTLSGNHPGVSATIALQADNLQYVSFENLIVDAASVATEAISINQPASGNTSATPHHIRFKNMEVKNALHNCVQVNGYSHHNWFTGGNYHDCGLANPTLPLGTNKYHGFYSADSDSIYENLQIYNIVGRDFMQPYSWGMHFYNSNPPCANRNIIRSIYAHKTAGILVWCGDSNMVYNNIVSGGIYGFSVGGGATNTKVYNNTVYNNSSTGIDTANSTGTIIKNNIIYQNGGGAVNNAGVSVIISNNLMMNPTFVDTSASNFRLQPGSAAIDTAANLTSEGVTTDYTGRSRPQGSGFDIGAFEYY